MTDKKLTDNEIVKAWGSYKADIGCAKCGFKDKYLLTVIDSTLDLINDQDEEINRLQAENERLKIVKDGFIELQKLYRTAKSEALKEFVYDLMQIPNVSVYKYEIKNLLKEKTGEDI